MIDFEFHLAGNWPCRSLLACDNGILSLKCKSETWSFLSPESVLQDTLITVDLEETFSLPHMHPVTCCAVYKNVLATAYKGGITISRFPGVHEPITLSMDSRTSHFMAFNSDGSYLSCCSGSQVLVFHLKTGKKIELNGHLGQVNQACFLPANLLPFSKMWIMSISDDRTFKGFSIESLISSLGYSGNDVFVSIVHFISIRNFSFGFGSVQAACMS